MTWWSELVTQVVALGALEGPADGLDPATQHVAMDAVSEGAGWLASVFDPTWNQTHAVAIMAVVVVTLFAAGMGFPLPEDVPLTITGFTTTMQANGAFVGWRFVLAFCIVTVPIILGDLVAYSMGKRWGLGLRDRFRMARSLLTDSRMAMARGWFRKRGSWAVFLGRQVAGVRFATFFTAGTLEMSLSKFILFDFLGCLVSVPVWLGLGFLGARYGREWLERASSNVGLAFVLVVAAVVGIWGFSRWRKLRRQRALDREAQRTSVSSTPAAPTAADSVANGDAETTTRVAP